MTDLTRVESHFRFGENWAQFARRISPAQIETARGDLARLLGTNDLAGISFLDIGCGSGLHALAALQLGAREVTAIDIDQQSVATTQNLLGRLAPHPRWTILVMSVFDAPQQLGKFDIVYSWGVLHHTGAMRNAIRAASSLVTPNGKLCVALYAKTPLCGFWRVEKRFYSRASAPAQRAIRGLYLAWMWLISTLALLRRGRLFRMQGHVKGHAHRGMEFYTDVHDWLGGYPYESIAPVELREYMAELGFREVRAFLVPGGRTGLLGSGCDEYVFERETN